MVHVGGDLAGQAEKTSGEPESFLHPTCVRVCVAGGPTVSTTSLSERPKARPGFLENPGSLAAALTCSLLQTDRV